MILESLLKNVHFWASLDVYGESVSTIQVAVITSIKKARVNVVEERQQFGRLRNFTTPESYTNSHSNTQSCGCWWNGWCGCKSSWACCLSSGKFWSFPINPCLNLDFYISFRSHREKATLNLITPITQLLSVLLFQMKGFCKKKNIHDNKQLRILFPHSKYNSL